MRTEKEMFDLILGVAKGDKRILAVYMNGSRTNENAKKDIFQDYDIIYVVSETESFIEDKTWIDRFGERLFMQYPEESVYYPSDKHNSYGWLIQFADGNRLDLHVETAAITKKNILEDKLCKILLDKQGILPEIPQATDEDRWVRKPTQEEFLCTCNEFWWCLDNVAKGLWREEIPYVQDMVNGIVRKQLIKVLSWKIGILTHFSCSIGKSGKYMYRWLEKEDWQAFLDTYFSADVEQGWISVMKMTSLFDRTARVVAEKLKYTYHEEEAIACQKFLEHIRTLPKDAKKIY